MRQKQSVLSTIVLSVFFISILCSAGSSEAWIHPKLKPLNYNFSPNNGYMTGALSEKNIENIIKLRKKSQPLRKIAFFEWDKCKPEHTSLYLASILSRKSQAVVYLIGCSLTQKKITLHQWFVLPASSITGTLHQQQALISHMMGFIFANVHINGQFADYLERVYKVFWRGFYNSAASTILKVKKHPISATRTFRQLEAEAKEKMWKALRLLLKAGKQNMYPEGWDSKFLVALKAAIKADEQYLRNWIGHLVKNFQNGELKYCKDVECAARQAVVNHAYEMSTHLAKKLKLQYTTDKHSFAREQRKREMQQWKKTKKKLKQRGQAILIIILLVFLIVFIRLLPYSTKQAKEKRRKHAYEQVMIWVKSIKEIDFLATAEEKKLIEKWMETPADCSYQQLEEIVEKYNSLLQEMRPRISNHLTELAAQRQKEAAKNLKRSNKEKSKRAAQTKRAESIIKRE